MSQYYYLIKRKSSNRWYYRFKHEKTYHSTKCRKKNDAVKYVENILYGGLKDNEIPVLSDFAKDFFLWDKCSWVQRQHKKKKRFSKSHAKDRRGILVNHILPRFGNRLMSSITPTEIEDWLLTIDRSNQTLNQILFTMRIIYKEAERQCLIKHNPANKIEQFATDYKQRDILSDSEVEELFPLNFDDFKNLWGNYSVGIMCYLLVSSGMRQGEARALKWEDIDWNNDIININHSMKSDNSRGCTKNGKSRVSVLTRRTKEFLLYLRENSDFNTDEDFIFTITGERPFWTNHLYKYFNKALKAIGIPEDKNIVVHSLRHTFISNCRKRQLPEMIIQKIVGHSDSAVTDIYDHTEDIEFLRFNNQNINIIKNMWETEPSSCSPQYPSFYKLDSTADILHNLRFQNVKKIILTS